MQSLVSFLFLSEDLIPHELYKIRSKGSTRRQFEMCGLRNKTETGVEVRVVCDGPNYTTDWVKNYKVLTMAENKANMYELEASYPQMVCQFVAAARHARFNTDTHHILYSVSMCGKRSILLARAHVWKQLTERTESCIGDQPALEKSHFLYRKVTSHDSNQCYDVFPILTIYMAVKAVTLLHMKTTFS
ncbi:uncharacterized protein LOC144446841 [Glandiceps talaboti]